MSIQKIDDAKLLEAKRFHITQPDIPDMSAEEMKSFMDHVPREVIIPKVNEIIDGVNEALGLEDTGDERNFITPAVGVKFYEGFYFNATAETLTEEGFYSSGTEYHIMDVTLENGTVKPVYIRSNYSGSYSVHPDIWTWNTDILLEGPKSTYVSMTGYGKVEISAVSELAVKYVSVLPVLDPSFKFASEQYVQSVQPTDSVTGYKKSGNWYCRTWSSGVKECWCSIKRYYEATNNGLGISDPDTAIIMFPSGFFTDTPTAIVNSVCEAAALPQAYIHILDKNQIVVGIQTRIEHSGSVVISIYCIGE